MEKKTCELIISPLETRDVPHGTVELYRGLTFYESLNRWVVCWLHGQSLVAQRKIKFVAVICCCKVYGYFSFIAKRIKELKDWTTYPVGWGCFSWFSAMLNIKPGTIASVHACSPPQENATLKGVDPSPKMSVFHEKNPSHHRSEINRLINPTSSFWNQHVSG